MLFRSIPTLVTAAGDGYRLRRYWALKALYLMGPKAAPAGAATLKALDDENEFIRTIALRMLASLEIDKAEAAPAVRKALQDPSDIVREAAAQVQKTYLKD